MQQLEFFHVPDDVLEAIEKFVRENPKAAAYLLAHQVIVRSVEERVTTLSNEPLNHTV